MKISVFLLLLLTLFACQAETPQEARISPAPVFSPGPTVPPTATPGTAASSKPVSEPSPTAPVQAVPTVSPSNTAGDVLYLDGATAYVSTVYNNRPELGWPTYFDTQRKQFLMLGQKSIDYGISNDFFIYYSDLKHPGSEPQTEFSFADESPISLRLQAWDSQRLIALSTSLAFNRLFFLDLNGQVSPVYDSSEKGYRDGPLASALFHSLKMFLVDHKQKIYVFDESNYRIRKIDLHQEQVDTLRLVSDASGVEQGMSLNATDMTLDPLSNIYVLNSFRSTIHKITPDGHLTTLEYTDPDKVLFQSLGFPLNNPACIVHHKGVLYICDTDNNLIRSLGPDGILRIVAGSVVRFREDSAPSHQDRLIQCMDKLTPHLPSILYPDCFRDGHALSQAGFNRPSELFFDDQDNLYVVDSANRALRKITFNHYAPGTTPPSGPGVTPDIPHRPLIIRYFNGRIFDDTHAPLSDVTVLVRSLDPARPFEESTRAYDGAYSFNNIPINVPIEIIASKPGFTTRRRVETVQRYIETQPHLNRFDFGTDGTDSGTGNIYNALSDLPEVSQVFPANGACQVPADTLISLTFSEPMDRQSVEEGFGLFVPTAAEPELVLDIQAFTKQWDPEVSTLHLRFKSEHVLNPAQSDYLIGFKPEHRLLDKVGVGRNSPVFKFDDNAPHEAYSRFSLKACE